MKPGTMRMVLEDRGDRISTRIGTGYLSLSKISILSLGIEYIPLHGKCMRCFSSFRGDLKMVS